MEMLTNKEVKPLTIKLTNGKGEEDEKLTHKIKTAILDVVNEHIGISAQEVLKLLLNGLKMPKDENINLYNYIRNATIWVINNKREQVSKPIGKFVNVIEYYNDFRERGYDDEDKLNKKYFELLCYHIAYENPFVRLSKLQEIHKTCLYKCKTLSEYLKAFEESLDKINIAIPKEALMDKAERKIKEWEEILKELEK